MREGDMKLVITQLDENTNWKPEVKSLRRDFALGRLTGKTLDAYRFCVEVDHGDVITWYEPHELLWIGTSRPLNQYQVEHLLNENSL